MSDEVQVCAPIQEAKKLPVIPNAVTLRLMVQIYYDPSIKAMKVNSIATAERRAIRWLTKNGYADFGWPFSNKQDLKDDDVLYLTKTGTAYVEALLNTPVETVIKEFS